MIIQTNSGTMSHLSHKLCLHTVGEDTQRYNTQLLLYQTVGYFQNGETNLNK